MPEAWNQKVTCCWVPSQQTPLCHRVTAIINPNWRSLPGRGSLHHLQLQACFHSHQPSWEVQGEGLSKPTELKQLHSGSKKITWCWILHGSSSCLTPPRLKSNKTILLSQITILHNPTTFVLFLLLWDTIFSKILWSLYSLEKLPTGTYYTK